MKTLKATIAELNAIDPSCGIWAESPFTAESRCRIGQIQFKNSGKLDDMEFVGTLANLSPQNYAPAYVCVRWGDSEHSVATTDGCDDVFPLGVGAAADLLNPAAGEIEAAEAASLWKAHIAPILAEFSEIYPSLKGINAAAFQEWLAEMRAAVECGAHLDTLIIAEEGDTFEKSGWVQLYVEERDGTDEATHRDVEADSIIEWAEECRQDLAHIEAERLAALKKSA